MCLTQYTAMPYNNCFNGTCTFIQLFFCSWHVASASFVALADICEGSQPTSFVGSFISGVAVSHNLSSRGSQGTLLSRRGDQKFCPGLPVQDITCFSVKSLRSYFWYNIQGLSATRHRLKTFPNSGTKHYSNLSSFPRFICESRSPPPRCK